MDPYGVILFVLLGIMALAWLLSETTPEPKAGEKIVEPPKPPEAPAPSKCTELVLVTPVKGPTPPKPPTRISSRLRRKFTSLKLAIANARKNRHSEVIDQYKDEILELLEDYENEITEYAHKVELFAREVIKK